MKLLIIISGLYLITGIVSTILYELLTKNMEVRLFGYHFHHSMWGIIFIIIGLLLHSFLNPLYLIMMGIGIIIQHTAYDKRLVFID